MIRLFPILLFTLATTLGAAEKPSLSERLTQLLERFPEADANGDGKLTLEEAQAYREARKQEEKSDRKGREKAKTPPTFADISYGEHERQKFDLWLPKENPTGSPFPVLVYFHGGGFVSGDKSSFSPDGYLADGIACASVNYRLVDGKESLSPIPLEDALLALQHIRHAAPERNLDGGRIALSGGSAGAVIALCIAYLDDQADPESENPVRRVSTRVTCVVPINGPTNLMPDWIVENIGGSKKVHGSFPKMFGEPVEHPVSESLRAKVSRISPWEFVSADDPPTFMIYSGPLDETPLPETATSGKVIHHPAFGVALKKRLDELGVENALRYGFDPRGTPSISEFIRTQFRMLD